MNPVTGAVPPLIRGHGIRFEVDRWTWRRLDAARFDGERRHLLATRGRPWHADPEHGGETDALETWHLLAGRHHGGGTSGFFHIRKSATSRFNSSAYRRSSNRMDIPTHPPLHYHPSTQPDVTSWAAPYTRQ